MLRVEVNQVYMIAQHSPAGKSSGMFRVLHEDRLTDRTWLIFLPRRRESFCRGAFVESSEVLSKMLLDESLKKVDLSPNPIWNMADDQIRLRYPSNAEGEECQFLVKRDMKWRWIQDFVEGNTIGHVLVMNSASSWIAQRSKELQIERNKLADALNRYWAGGLQKNALLPNWMFSGDPGGTREQTRKIGRPDANSERDGDRGYFLTEGDKEKLRHGWNIFVKPNCSVHTAYLMTCGIFYSKGVKSEGGYRLPELLDKRQRPTLAQFKKWGPGCDAGNTASRQKLRNSDYENNFRGLRGCATDVSIAVGSMAFTDSTSTDVHLVSIADPLKPIGMLHRLLIKDARSTVIAGWYCGLDAPSARTFLLAVANAASSKKDVYARFGIEISESQDISAVFKTYIGDNGEFRNEQSISALTNFNATIQYAKSGVAVLKAPVESYHHVVQTRMDHQLTGTTFGRQRERGEPAPATKAIHKYPSYMREFLEETLYYNTVELVPHLLTLEMRAVELHPTRMNIFRWYQKMGYAPTYSPDIAAIHAHLYPPIRGRMTPSGVKILRDDAGNKNVFVSGVVFSSKYLYDSGLLERARRLGNFDITLRGDICDLRKMWMVTDAGVFELEGASPDPLLHELTIQDLNGFSDSDLELRVAERQNQEQARLDIINKRGANEKELLRKKKDALAQLTRPPTKKELTAGVRVNRQAEHVHLKNAGLTQGPHEMRSSGEEPAAIEKKSAAESTESISEMAEEGGIAKTSKVVEASARGQRKKHEDFISSFFK